MITPIARWNARRTRARERLCLDCGQPLTLRTFQVEGRSGSVRAVFHELPCLACDHPGHPKRFATPGFGRDLMDALYLPGTGTLPFSRHADARHRSCFACAGEMPDREQTELATVAGPIDLAGLPSFRLEISGPCAPCPACERIQVYVHRDTVDHLDEAVVSAFRALRLSAG